jgi:chromatin remodeling complex protein RSC6
MVRKLSATSAAPAAPVTAPSVAPVVQEAAAPAKKASKASKTAKTQEVAAVAPVTTPVVQEAAPVNEVVSTETVPLDSSSELLQKFVEFKAKLQTLSTQFSAARTEFQLLEKQVTKVVKQKMRGKKKLSGNRQPSGFIKPTLISNDLAEFLGKPIGIEMARTEVSREINNYIKQHNLKDQANGRNINPDSKLSTLLKLGSEDRLTYFNLQKYMKHHFIKETSIPATVTA